MLASQAIDITETTELPSLAHAGVNAGVRVGIGYVDFARAVVRDNRHAIGAGKRVVDAYTSPDGREGDGSAKVKTFPTDIRPIDLARIEKALKTLGRLAARVNVEDVPTVERAMRAKLAEMSNLDPALWGVWVESAKAHMPGDEAAALDIDGFAWTASRKGYSSTIRNDESADKWARQNRSEHTGGIPTGSLSEDDLLAEYGL